MSETRGMFLEECEQQINEDLEKYNKAIKGGKIVEIKTAETQLKESEKKYAAQKAVDVYAECKEQANPILYAIQRFTYEVLVHKDIKEDGVLTGAEIGTRVRTIDLYRMCTANHLDTGWAFLAQDHCLTLLLAQCSELGFTPEQIQGVSSSYAMARKAREFFESKTNKSKKNPISKKSMLSELQGVVDGVMTAAKVDLSTYKVNNHDMQYLMALYFKKGKNALALSASNHAYYRRILMDVLHRVVCGLTYGVEFDMIDATGHRQECLVYADVYGKTPEVTPATADAKDTVKVSEAEAKPAPAPKAEGAPAEPTKAPTEKSTKAAAKKPAKAPAKKSPKTKTKAKADESTEAKVTVA